MRMHDEENLSIAQKEFDLLRQVNHPNIIRALDFFTYAMGAVLVLDYFAGNKLMKAVRSMPGRHLQESTARRLSVQLLGAVGHLHERGVIHRDVKADNILVSYDMSDLRLVDFNAAKQIAESQALTMTGTVDYMPPEVLQGESPSQAGDIWAVGLCFYIMLDGKLPSERRALHRSLDGGPGHQEHPQSGSLVLLGGKRWSRTSELCKKVLRSCLEFNSDLRPNASDLMAMSWLAVESLNAAPGTSGYC
jgi:serine/threonine protein kinase